MNLADFLDRLTSILEEADVAYMLTGSLAAAYYAEPRATRDVDLVIAASPGQVEELVNRLDRDGLYVSLEAAREAVLDRGHMERWVDELGLDREWARLVEEFDLRDAEQARPRGRVEDRPKAAATEEPPVARRRTHGRRRTSRRLDGTAPRGVHKSVGFHPVSLG